VLLPLSVDDDDD